MMLKITVCSLLFFYIFVSALFGENFAEKQDKYERVRNARNEKINIIKEYFSNVGVGYPPKEIFIRIFKHSRELELWARPDTAEKFFKIKDFPICRISGRLGPKRREGDFQVPEGFYEINMFNPFSDFHLSLGINYPNRSDRILGDPQKPGGAIFIHGNCVSIGCVAITDEGIKELYVIAVDTKNNGQSAIPVHIFPCKMDSAGMDFLKEYAGNDSLLLKFWENLKTGYDYFETHKKLPKISVGKDGRYIFRGK